MSPTSGPDDLLTAAGQGDQAAFGAFYDRTVSFVFPLLRGTLGDTRRANEATERIYVRLWRTAPRFRAGDECACGLLLAAARQELAR